MREQRGLEQGEGDGRPVAPRRGHGHRPRPAGLAALADHPAPGAAGAGTRRDHAGAVAAGPYRARALRGGRRRDLLGAHRAGRGRRAGGLAGPDAVPDAGRGRRPQRRSTRWSGPPGEPVGDSAGPDGARTRSAGGSCSCPGRISTRVLADAPRAGMWAYEARRIAAGVPRIGVDTDHRTIPNEAGLIGPAVHLDKGCYRGQETVARVHTLGRPPRRLVRLHLDGSVDALPGAGHRAGAGRPSRRLRRQLGPALRARPDRPRPGQAQRRPSTPSC